MSEFSVDQKLMLIRQVRNQHNRDRMDLMNRERILFGRTGQYRDLDLPEQSTGGYGNASYGSEYNYNQENEADCQTTDQSNPLKRALFKIRLMAALILAVLLILLDQQNSTFLGVSTNEIFTMIEKDYYTQVEEYINGLQQSTGY